MKKINLRGEKALLAVAVFAAFSLAAGCGKREIKNLDAKGRNIVCFGDSITFGYGVSPDKGFPSSLSKMISMPVINAGLDGNTSREGLKRIDSDVLSRDPYMVIIEFGGNDFLRRVPVDETIENIEKMVERVQAHGAIAAIADISAGMVLKEYLPYFKKIARERGALFIPSILAGIITNPQMKSDFFHPNETGYKLIAQRVYQIIKPYLKE